MTFALLSRFSRRIAVAGTARAMSSSSSSSSLSTSNAFPTYRKALVRALPRSFVDAIGPDDVAAVDYAKAAAQHAAYVTALRGCIDVVEIAVSVRVSSFYSFVHAYFVISILNAYILRT
jgi:hypothetical protein